MTQFVHIHQINCQQSKPAKFICINPACNNSCISCAHYLCKSCQNNHQYCKTYFYDTFIHKITAKMKNIAQSSKKSFMKIIEKISQAIKYLQKIRENWENKMEYYGLSLQQIAFLKQANSDCISINGSLTNHIFKNLNSITLVNAKQDHIQKYWNNMQSVFHAIFDFQKIYHKQQFQLDSKIICENQQLDQYNTKQKIIEANNRISSFFDLPIVSSKLLYRASQSNYNHFEFMKKCQRISNTIVLAKTEQDKIIGGFNPFPWINQDCRIYDKNRRTFLFSVTQNKKYNLKKGCKALQYNMNHGPNFGQNALKIGANCHKEITSTCNLNQSFENPNHSFITNQQIQKFSGCQKSTFLIKQWQVFQVKFPIEEKLFKKLFTQSQMYISEDAMGGLFD